MGTQSMRDSMASTRIKPNLGLNFSLANRRLTRLLLLVIVCLAWSTGPAGASDSEADTVSFNLEIQDGHLTRSDKTIRVHKNDTVQMNWTTDIAMTIHLHGYDLEQQIIPAVNSTLSFSAYATGRYPLVVHADHGASDSHGGHDALLYLEVLPR
jgi:FtsP/CotA-like multicopper oxidase with cupredoxin domain